jgi:hypothetical protein
VLAVVYYIVEEGVCVDCELPKVIYESEVVSDE